MKETRTVLILISWLHLIVASSSGSSLFSKEGSEYFESYLGLAARKPVFEVSYKESFKPVSSATETS